MRILMLFAFTCGLLACSGCGKKETPSSAVQSPAGGGAEKAADPDALKKLDPRLAATVKAIQAAEGAQTRASQIAEAVDFRQLATLLPEEVSGLKRKDTGGQKMSQFGTNVSYAQAEYEAEAGAEGESKSLDAKLTDVGSMSGDLALFAAWASGEIDEENEDGYRRTITLKGYKGIEEFDKANNEVDLKLVVADRFVVELKGHQMSAEEVKAVLGKIDLAKLEGMKDQGVGAAQKVGK